MRLYWRGQSRKRLVPQVAWYLVGTYQPTCMPAVRMLLTGQVRFPLGYATLTVARNHVLSLSTPYSELHVIRMRQDCQASTFPFQPTTPYPYKGIPFDFLYTASPPRYILDKSESLKAGISRSSQQKTDHLSPSTVSFHSPALPALQELPTVPDTHWTHTIAKKRVSRDKDRVSRHVRSTCFVSSSSFTYY